MNSKPILSIEWITTGQGHLRLLDQTTLPTSISYVDCHHVESVWEAIRTLRVRGAPAIGIAAAYGIVVGLERDTVSNRDKIVSRLEDVKDYLASSRPTAVNLFWALDRMQAKWLSLSPDFDQSQVREELLAEAVRIHDEDRAMCHAIGRHGAELLRSARGVLTHCNTGGLATSEYGTALSVFFTAQDQGNLLHVYVDETRPLLQGARLTAWELMQRNIPATLICDSMAAQVMREGRVQAVVVGADRIAANGDAANKIGTYSVAILAKHHSIPFYVAAPSNTFDLSIENGTSITIEQRDSREVTEAFGKRTAPIGIDVYNPAFDVTPAELISGIITEHGVIRPVNRKTIDTLLKR